MISAAVENYTDRHEYCLVQGDFVHRTSAPLAHGSGGAFVHDGRGFRRYALLCSFFCRGHSLRPAGLESVLLFFAADVPCALRAWSPFCSFLPRTFPAPCGLGVRSALFCRGRSLRPAGLESVLLFCAAGIPCALRAWSPFCSFLPRTFPAPCGLGVRSALFCRGRSLRPAGLESVLLFFAADVPCALRAWSPLPEPQSWPLYQPIKRVIFSSRWYYSYDHSKRKLVDLCVAATH